MATTPDPHPDSLPAGPADDPERVAPAGEPGRESVEDLPGDQYETDGSGRST